MNIKDLQEEKEYLAERMLMEFENITIQTEKAINYLNKTTDELLSKQVDAMITYKGILGQRIIKIMKIGLN